MWSTSVCVEKIKGGGDCVCIFIKTIWMEFAMRWLHRWNVMNVVFYLYEIAQ